ncbi:MAG: DUF6516 family protein [bacterium]
MYEIIRKLKNSPLIDGIKVIELIDEKTFKLLKVEAYISDHSLLYIHELHTQSYQKYSYHWQNSNGELILRWDNKPHWKHLATFPHHRHEKGEVVESHRITIGELLETIQNRLSDLATP